MNTTNFKAGDKVRIIPKNGNTNITYDNGEVDTIVKINGDRALINYWGDFGEDWWGLDELMPYSPDSKVPPVKDYANSQFSGLGLSNLRSSLSAQDEINLREENQNLRMRNMELEAALAVTTESLGKANYEKYLLELENAKMKEAIEEIFAMSDDLFGGHDELNEETHEENEEYLIAKLDSVREIAAGILYPKAPTAQAASEVTLSDTEIDFLINNPGDTSEDYEDYTAPSYLIPDALYKKLEKLTDFTIFANHYRLAREYDTEANRAAISARRKALGLEA